MIFECVPSVANLELYWTYETNDSFGNITIDNVFQSKFLIESTFLHKLILPIADVSDAGNYSCVIRRPPNDTVIISETISLNVLPGK